MAGHSLTESPQNPFIQEMNIDKTLSSSCLIHRPYSHFANHCNGGPTQEHRLRVVVRFCVSPSNWDSPTAFPLTVVQRTTFPPVGHRPLHFSSCAVSGHAALAGTSQK